MPNHYRQALTFLIAILTLLPLNGQAGDLILNPTAITQNLDPQLDFLYDQGQIYHIGQMVDEDSHLPWKQGWQVDKTLIIDPGLYWFKGRLVNDQATAIELTLQVEHPSINVADLYIVDDQGHITTIYSDAGMDGRYDNRPIPHRNLVNSITIPAHGSLTLIWRIYSEPLFQFHASLWQPRHFIEHNQHYQLFYGMLYGILLVMALYNLFLYTSTREISYGYYVLYVLSFCYLLAADRGHIYQYFATDEIWAKLPIYAIIYAFNILMFGQFSINFLNLRKRNRTLLWVIRWLAIISALSVIGVVISSNSTLLIFGLLTISLMFLAALLAGVIVRKAGVISAGHFVIAIMILVFSLIATNMASLGLISGGETTESLTAIGTTAMLIFFSLALADRINQLQKENTEANLGMAEAHRDKQKTRSELLKSQTLRIQLEQVASEAKLESRSKSDFLATLSHEIRTPMNGVLDITELMKATPLNEQQSSYLNTIEHSGQSLLSIINDLQDFAKIEAGKMELDIASFNLEALIDDCISTFAPRAMEKNLNFIADLEPSIDPVLRGDVSKLRQIILHLLSNAFKFTEHGDILLRVCATEKAAINSVELKFEVQDSGIGLTQDEQKRLFTPFHHADKSTYGRYGGSGLGLSISKQLAELMDGTIRVSSESGQGSRFWFTARFLTDEQPDASLLRIKSSLLSGQRLLLIAPHNTSAESITRLLTSWQMKVSRCINSADALQEISQASDRNQAFDIILCEHDLENGDGLHLAKQLQEEKRSTATFVLMATDRKLSNPSERQQSGIKILLEKPITTARLHDAMQQAIVDSEPSPPAEH